MWSECGLICYKSNYGDMRFDSLLITHTCMTTQKLTIWSSITCCLYEKMMICKYFIKTYDAFRASNKENSILILFTSNTISEMFYGYSWTMIYANKWCLQKKSIRQTPLAIDFFLSNAFGISFLSYFSQFSSNLCCRYGVRVSSKGVTQK